MTFEELISQIISAKDVKEFSEIMDSIDTNNQTEFCTKLLEKIRADREFFKHRFSWGIIELSNSHFSGNKLNTDFIAETSIEVIDESKLDDLTLGGLSNLRLIKIPKKLVPNLLLKIWRIIDTTSKWRLTVNQTGQNTTRNILKESLLILGCFAELSGVDRIKTLTDEEIQNGGQMKKYFGECLLRINRRLKPEHQFCNKCNKETIWDTIDIYDLPYRCTVCRNKN